MTPVYDFGGTPVHLPDYTASPGDTAHMAGVTGATGGTATIGDSGQALRAYSSPAEHWHSEQGDPSAANVYGTETAALSCHHQIPISILTDPTAIVAVGVVAVGSLRSYAGDWIHGATGATGSHS